MHPASVTSQRTSRCVFNSVKDHKTSQLLSCLFSLCIIMSLMIVPEVGICLGNVVKACSRYQAASLSPDMVLLHSNRQDHYRISLCTQRWKSSSKIPCNNLYYFQFNKMDETLFLSFSDLLHTWPVLSILGKVFIVFIMRL